MTKVEKLLSDRAKLVGGSDGKLVAQSDDRKNPWARMSPLVERVAAALKEANEKVGAFRSVDAKH